MKSPKRSPLVVPDEYISALGEVLGMDLGSDRLSRRDARQWLDRLSTSVQELSEGLTRDRERFFATRYLKDRSLREAYLAYYTTTNILKIWPPLRELALGGFFAERKSLKVLDLGSGTGAAAWGTCLFAANETSLSHLSIILSDAVAESLREGLGLWQSLRGKLRSSLDVSVRSVKFDVRSAIPQEIENGAPYDIITMMNVVNELTDDIDDELIPNIHSLLAPEGAIIMIEPSSREESRRALRFRDRLVDAGFHIYSPCTKTGHCPALLKDDDWCHTEIPWERPDLIREIDDRIGTLRLSLKSTYIVAMLQNQNLSDSFHPDKLRDFSNVGRVISELFVEKGRKRAIICNEVGKREFVMNNRDKREGNAEFGVAERYDLISVSGVEEREHDVKVGQDGSVNRLLGSTGAR